MIFQFLKYNRPTWYFNLKSKGVHHYWLDYYKLTNEEKKLLSLDNAYSSEAVSLLDVAYQAWIKGLVVHGENKLLSIDITHVKPSIRDNYHFVKKHFSILWLWYILLLRIISLNNPVKEVKAFIPVLISKKKKNNELTYLYDLHEITNLSEKKVSIILPTLNRYNLLRNILEDISVQTFSVLEVIVVDQSENAKKSFYDLFSHLPLDVVFQEAKGQWTARNYAIKKAKGDYILLLDDDSRVDPKWVEYHLKALDKFKVDISAGASYYHSTKNHKRYYQFRWADDFDSGNVMVKKEVFKKIGLFDMNFDKQRMGDREFGLRAYMNGFKSVFNPKAFRMHLYAKKGGLRHYNSWNGYSPSKEIYARPMPSVIYFFLKYFKHTYKYDLLINIPQSFVPLRYRFSLCAKIFALITSFFLLPILVFQIYKAHVLGIDMLNKEREVDYL